LHPDEVKLAPNEHAACCRDGRLRCHDRGAEVFVRPLEPRGEVHHVAHCRVVEAAARADMPINPVPVLSPMRCASLSDLSVSPVRSSSASRRRQASAARTALVACAGSSSGAPNIAAMASPMYLSTKPPCTSMMSVIAERYSFMSATISPGLLFSESVEKPATSEKNEVMVGVSPPGTGWRFAATILSISVGAR